MVDVLLELGADTNVKDNDGNTALSHASKQNHEEIVKMFYKKFFFDIGKKMFHTLSNFFLKFFI